MDIYFKLSRKSKILIHILFWVCYYLLFGAIWVKDDGLLRSYYLEFVLLPPRIGLAYLTIYYLIPDFLIKKRFAVFFGGYLGSLFAAGIMQRLFLYFFYDANQTFDLAGIFAPGDVVRAMILINTTVIFVASAYILNLYFQERAKNEALQSETKESPILEIKSNKRIYKVPVEDIVYIEGMGNYVNYQTVNGEKITRYASLKDCLSELPDSFLRTHRSFIINKRHVRSYNQESVEMPDDVFVPVGNSYGPLEV